MQKTFDVKRMVLASMMVALCVVLPIAFHAVPNGGATFLPMHIPILLCGMLCGWHYGVICGLLGPLLSCLLTGMPAMAILPAMMVECAVYGLVTGLTLRFVRTGKLYIDLYIALILALLLGRVMSGKGGDTILATCQAVLKDEFPALYEKVEVMLPDEKTRRVGQSAAAASLPAARQ